MPPENLLIAARDPACRHGILDKLMQEMATVTGGRVDMHIMDVAAQFRDGGPNEDLLILLKDGFIQLLQRVGSL